MEYFLSFYRHQMGKSQICSHLMDNARTHETKHIREVKHHVYVKRQTQIRTTWQTFLFTCRLLFIISTPKLVVSRNF